MRQERVWPLLKLYFLNRFAVLGKVLKTPMSRHLGLDVMEFPQKRFFHEFLEMPPSNFVPLIRALCCRWPQKQTIFSRSVPVNWLSVKYAFWGIAVACFYAIKKTKNIGFTQQQWMKVRDDRWQAFHPWDVVSRLRCVMFSNFCYVFVPYILWTKSFTHLLALAEHVIGIMITWSIKIWLESGLHDP